MSFQAFCQYVSPGVSLHVSCVLQLQESVLCLEEEVREARLKAKHADDQLQAQLTRQQELTARYRRKTHAVDTVKSFLFVGHLISCFFVGRTILTSIFQRNVHFIW